MSYKNCIIKDPQIGGAKGGIKFNPKNSEAKNVLTRFLIDHKTIIESMWCTGGDLNTTNEAIEAIVKKNLGLPTAFICLAKSISNVEKIPDQSPYMSSRITTPFNELFNIGDCATGYSICQTIKFVTSKTPKVIIQGFGKVGSSLAFLLQDLQIATIVGICDKDGFIYNAQGIDVLPLIKAKFSPKYDSFLPLKSLLNPEQCHTYHWTTATNSNEKTLSNFFNSVKADIFSPCADRYSITEQAIKHFIDDKSQKFIISGANNPFVSIEVIKFCLQNNIVVIPDWVSNAGNAILFVEALRHLQWDHNAVGDMLKLIKNYVQQFLKEAKFIHSVDRISLFESCYQIAHKKRRS